MLKEQKSDLGNEQNWREIMLFSRAVVVAQLVGWSLPTPEVCGSNPVILLHGTFVYCRLYQKDGNKEKDAGHCPFLKK